MLTSLRRCLKLPPPNFLFRQLSSSTNQECVLVDSHFDVRLISINRPDKRNSLNIETINQLKEALLEFDNDEDMAVGVLYGEGGIFCSGFDMDEILEKGYEPLLQACENFRRGPLCKKPLIAAVDGYAVGEGFELALACDLRVIEDTALLGFLGKRFGAPTLLGGVERLTEMVGVSRAMTLLCSAFQLNGHTAETWGLVSRLVSTGTCIGQAVNLAISVAKYPQNSVIHDKMLLYQHLNDKDQTNRQAVEYLEILKGKAITDINANAVKFKEGVGKHGSFKDIKPKRRPDWEKEDDQFEKA